MNLYLISQNVNTGYDTYDSAVVCANNEEEARNILPGGSTFTEEAERELEHPEYYFPQSDWVNNKADVIVEYIGVASIKFEKTSVICASFNAG